MPTIKKNFEIEIKDGVVSKSHLGSIKQGEQFTNQILAVIKDKDENEYLPSGNYSCYLHVKRADGYRHVCSMCYSASAQKWYVPLKSIHTKVPGPIECTIEVRILVTDSEDQDTITMVDSVDGEDALDNSVFAMMSKPFTINVEKNAFTTNDTTIDPDYLSALEADVNAQLNDKLDDIDTILAVDELPSGSELTDENSQGQMYFYNGLIYKLVNNALVIQDLKYDSSNTFKAKIDDNASEITKIKNGTTIAKKAEQDKNGNDFTTTYIRDVANAFSYANLSGKPTLFSGSYTDLTNKPTIPTVYNPTITIQANGTTVDSFSLNQSGNKTINIPVAQSSGGVDLTSNQTIGGNKTFTSTLKSACIEPVSDCLDADNYIGSETKRYYCVYTMYISNGSDEIALNELITSSNKNSLIGKASDTDLGLVKIGSGINVVDGVISTGANALFEDLSESITINDNGENIALTSAQAQAIYEAYENGKMGVVVTVTINEYETGVNVATKPRLHLANVYEHNGLNVCFGCTFYTDSDQDGVYIFGISVIKNGATYSGAFTDQTLR